MDLNKALSIICNDHITKKQVQQCLKEYPEECRKMHRMSSPQFYMLYRAILRKKGENLAPLDVQVPLLYVNEKVVDLDQVKRWDLTPEELWDILSATYGDKRSFFLEYAVKIGAPKDLSPYLRMLEGDPKYVYAFHKHEDMPKAYLMNIIKDESNADKVNKVVEYLLDQADERYEWSEADQLAGDGWQEEVLEKIGTCSDALLVSLCKHLPLQGGRTVCTKFIRNTRHDTVLQGIIQDLPEIFSGKIKNLELLCHHAMSVDFEVVFDAWQASLGSCGDTKDLYQIQQFLIKVVNAQYPEKMYALWNSFHMLDSDMQIEIIEATDELGKNAEDLVVNIFSTSIGNTKSQKMICAKMLESRRFSDAQIVAMLPIMSFELQEFVLNEIAYDAVSYKEISKLLSQKDLMKDLCNTLLHICREKKSGYWIEKLWYIYKEDCEPYVWSYILQENPDSSKLSLNAIEDALSYEISRNDTCRKRAIILRDLLVEKTGNSEKLLSI